MRFLPSQEWCKYGMLLEKGPLNAVQLLMRPLSVLKITVMPSLRNLVVNPDAHIFRPSEESRAFHAFVKVDGLVCSSV